MEEEASDDAWGSSVLAEALQRGGARHFSFAAAAGIRSQRGRRQGGLSWASWLNWAEFHLRILGRIGVVCPILMG
jgi:hypothetical protein